MPILQQIGKWSLPKSSPWVKVALVDRCELSMTKSRQEAVPQQLSMYVGKLSSFRRHGGRALMAASLDFPVPSTGVTSTNIYDFVLHPFFLL
jgi:hypothetical protein